MNNGARFPSPRDVMVRAARRELQGAQQRAASDHRFSSLLLVITIAAELAALTEDAS